MSMNLIIQQKRRELGLTQEQLAEYLNVSIPAVSKWETGSTCPDISLLPKLARILKTDLNTLFGFDEKLTVQEMGNICNDIVQTATTQGISKAFEITMKTIHQYPYNEKLLQTLAFQLDGLTAMLPVTEELKQQIDDKLMSWYHILAESEDTSIGNSARYMLAGRYLSMQNYEKAQEMIDKMPDKYGMLDDAADKRMLQVTIDLQTGNADKAFTELQKSLLQTVNKLQMLMNKMVDAELTAGDIDNAKCIAGKIRCMAEVFDLWEYNSYTAPLQIALKEKNETDSINILKNLLNSLVTPWNMNETLLFCRISEYRNETGTGQMLQAVLSGMENDEACQFLRENKEFKMLIDEYRKKAEAINQ